ncbi:MAG: apolipoprotein N-acyltransferase [Gemmataceae bacterium]
MKFPIPAWTLTWRHGLALGVSSALLLWLSYFPVDVGYCSWFALVPLLIVARFGSGRITQLAAWTCGLAFYITSLSWMRVADPTMAVAWIFLSIHCAAFLAFSMWLIRRLDRATNWPLTLTVPIVWTALEFARGRLFGGFSWYFLGHAQHSNAMLLQIADLGGELMLTFVVAAVNGLVTDVLTRPARTLRVPCYIVGCLIGLSLIYGAWQLRQANFDMGPKVALLQGNITQDIRNDAFAGNAQAWKDFMVRHFVALADRAATERPDLIVWPETSLPGESGNWYWYFATQPGDMNSIPLEQRLWIEESRVNFGYLGRRWGIPSLVGLNAAEMGPGDAQSRFNSAVLVDGAGNVRGRYDKMHRVPFGEYVPLQDTMPWLQKLTPYEGYEYSITAGREFTRFPIESAGKTYHFGTLICYEDADTELAREYVRTEPVDFLVNISNDGWFKGTPEHEQHLAVSQFRAVECRRALVRAVNLGISAVIDSNGRVTHLPRETWAKSKAIDGVVVANVPIDHRHSYYARWGDWLPWSCWSAIVFIVLYTRWRR